MAREVHDVAEHADYQEEHVDGPLELPAAARGEGAHEADEVQHHGDLEHLEPRLHVVEALVHEQQDDDERRDEGRRVEEEEYAVPVREQVRQHRVACEVALAVVLLPEAAGWVQAGLQVNFSLTWLFRGMAFVSDFRLCRVTGYIWDARFFFPGNSMIYLEIL